MHILATAEHFGFGPAGSLWSILRAYEDLVTQETRFSVIETESLRPLFRDRSDLNVIPNPDDKTFLEVLADLDRPGDFDLILSSFDSSSVFYGWFHDIPTVLYDGLFTFWDFDGFAEHVRGDIETLTACKDKGDIQALIASYREIFFQRSHSMIFGGHFVATHNFVRKHPDNPKIFGLFPELEDSTQAVGCLMNLSAVTKHTIDERRGFLVSTSGSLAPTMTLEQNVFYVTALVEFLAEVARRPLYRDEPWRFITHPQILAALPIQSLSLPENFELSGSVPPQQFWALISQSRALFTGPGFMAVEEPAYLETPTFILPEQNPSYHYCFKQLEQHGYPLEYNLTVSAHGEGFATYGDLGGGSVIETSRLYDDIRQLLRDDAHRPLRERLVDDFAQLLGDRDRLSTHLERQKNAIVSLMGGFDGATEVVGSLKTALRLD